MRNDAVVFARWCFCAGLVLATIVWSTRREAVAQGDNLASTLPTQSELPGFTGLKIRTTPSGDHYAVAKRQSDKMFLTIFVIKKDSDAAAQALTKELTLSHQGPGPMPKGSPSGRQIGQEVWQSHRGGGAPRGNLILTVRDGRCVVVVQAMYPVQGRDARGKVIRKPISSADLRFFEDLVTGRLTKLKAMKLTSGGPVVQAARARKPARR